MHERLAALINEWRINTAYNGKPDTWWALRIRYHLDKWYQGYEWDFNSRSYVRS